MFENRKKRKELERQIKEVEDRLLRTAEHEQPGLIGMAVSNLRWQKERLNAGLRQIDTDEWIAHARKHFIKFPPDEPSYWQTIEIDQADKQTLLTDEGKHFIKTAIHEKRFRFIQHWGWLVAIVTSILSLVVAIIALAKK